MNIDKYDKVTVNETALRSMIDWFQHESIDVENFLPPIEEGVLCMDDGNYITKLYFKVLGNKHFKFYQQLANGEGISWEKLDKDRINMSFDMESLDLLKSFKMREALFHMERFFFAVMSYMAQEPKKVEKETTKTRKVKKVKKGKRSNNKSKVVYVTNTVYKVSISDKFSEDEKREYKRSMEAWKVRGHWREYKSGKKVWIKPHVRGEDKDNIESKEYKIDFKQKESVNYDQN